MLLKVTISNVNFVLNNLRPFFLKENIRLFHKAIREKLTREEDIENGGKNVSKNSLTGEMMKIHRKKLEKNMIKENRKK